MAKASVYLETTIISYLTSRPSRDLVVSAHQQITHDWWDKVRRRFEIMVSEAVMEEIRSGDPDAAARRIEVARQFRVLELTEDVGKLAQIYQRELGVPSRAKTDVVHIAFAVAYAADYLMTWNCSHIANGEVIRRLIDLNTEMGRFTPLIVTPEELLEYSPEEEI
ncbi:MAG: type II toxin-antitoxin system VapC family toxin [Planctomycetota bacterium]